MVLKKLEFTLKKFGFKRTWGFRGSGSREKRKKLKKKI